VQNFTEVSWHSGPILGGSFFSGVGLFLLKISRKLYNNVHDKIRVPLHNLIRSCVNANRSLVILGQLFRLYHGHTIMISFVLWLICYLHKTILTNSLICTVRSRSMSTLKINNLSIFSVHALICHYGLYMNITGPLQHVQCIWN